MKNAIVSCAVAGGIGSACLAESAEKGSDLPAGGEGKYIDIHVHANAWSETGFNLDRVSEWMGRNHVTRCVILQFAQSLPRDDDEHKTLIENFKKYQGKIDRFCVIFAKDVTAKAEAVKILSRMKQEGAIGFGEHYGEGIHVDDPKNMMIYAACAEVGLPVLFHMDGKNNMDDKGLPRLENALKANPKCTFIAHATNWWANISGNALARGTVTPGGAVDRLLQKYPNLHGDLSAGSGAGAIGRDKEFGRAFLIRNADKLLFGTDSGPWSMNSEPAAQFTMFESLDLPADVKARIYRDNARSLLHLA
jgi:hypothetical protein